MKSENFFALLILGFLIWICRVIFRKTDLTPEEKKYYYEDPKRWGRENR